MTLSKVEPRYLRRSAYLYVRQSSMRQVLENTESTKRQYALQGRAIALGWTNDAIVVIDSDQGESGASSAWREGFKHLVAEVGMGKAGIVMGLEVSRLARNNADWHRLLEICALSDTLILDEEGIYDPSNFNDRLLLGLKGTMSEAELHVLKARLRGGILTKARRGEFRCPLPIGLLYAPDGSVVLDPDTQVQETIAHFFETFDRVGSAHRTVRAFRQAGIQFPVWIRQRGTTNTLIFRPLTATVANRTLHNPRYAGVYAFGRRRYRRTADGGKRIEELPPEEWTACIPGAHPGYITWEKHQENLKILARNSTGFDKARRPPREGSALLQGLGVCGVCGQRMRAKYQSRRGRLDVWYVCWRSAADRGDPACQSVAGQCIDHAVSDIVAKTVTPATIELAVAVRRELETRLQNADRIRSMAVQRAEQAADLARRRFMMVDPGNRLVADSLEADWNHKLRTVHEARREYERESVAAELTGRELGRLDALAVDFQKLWSAPDTPMRERKRMLAHIIDDVTMTKLTDQGVTQVHVRFRGGQTQSLTVANPLSHCERQRTPTEVIEAVDGLLDHHIYEVIAEILNRRGMRPGGAAVPGREDRTFTTKHISYIVRVYKLKPRYDRLRERGLLTRKEMMERLGISNTTLNRWADHDLVTRHPYNGHACLFEDPGDNPPTKQCSRWNTLASRAAKKQRVNSHSQRRSERLEEVQYEA